MRRAGPLLSALLLAAPAVAQLPAGERVPVPGTPVANQPQAQPAQTQPAQVDAALYSHLQGWEKVMQGTTNFHTECTLVKKSLLDKRETQAKGRIICLKPNLAWMRIDQTPAPGKQPNPSDYMTWICTGRAVYEYDANIRQVTEVLLPNGGVGDNLLLTFMSGSLKAADILQRFDMKLLKEDANYVYLEVRPREARDKQEFETLTLVLYGPSIPGRPQLAYLPSMVVMRKANGQDVEQWTFDKPQANVDGIKPELFRFYQPPEKENWKIQRAQAPAAAPVQPRVARPQGQ
jgi:TIGR03009 family protein